MTASPVTQDERVTSSSLSSLLPPKELPLLPPVPPDHRPPPPLYPGAELTSLGSLTTILHSPNNTNSQQTFLASSAAVKQATGDKLQEGRVPGTKLQLATTTSSSNTDSVSPLARNVILLI